MPKVNVAPLSRPSYGGYEIDRGRERRVPSASPPSGRRGLEPSGDGSGRTGTAVSFYAIVRGPLGAGKTTVSRQVASAVGGKHLAIDTILEDYQLEDWDEDGISETSFLRANIIAAREAAPPLRSRTPVIVDGNFYWKSAVDDLVARLWFPHAVFTLKAPLTTCIARDAGRSPSYGPDSAREVYAKTTAFDYGVVVDATGSVETTVEAILVELRRRFSLGR